jgi:hypothetical protein
MPLFTIIADYGGGTYLAQIQARSAKEAAIAWPKSPAVAELALLLDLPIASFKEVLRKPELSPVRSLSRCWCVTADLGDQLLLLHIVQSAEVERNK